MNRKTKSGIYRKLRLLFNVMMGVGYLLLSYLILLITFSGKNLENSKLAVLVIALCSIGQISHYYEGYRDIKKDISYYIGIIPPALALLCLIFAVSKMFFFG